LGETQAFFPCNCFADINSHPFFEAVYSHDHHTTWRFFLITASHNNGCPLTSQSTRWNSHHSNHSIWSQKHGGRFILGLVSEPDPHGTALEGGVGNIGQVYCAQNAGTLPIASLKCTNCCTHAVMISRYATNSTTHFHPSPLPILFLLTMKTTLHTCYLEAWPLLQLALSLLLPLVPLSSGRLLGRPAPLPSRSCFSGGPSSCSRDNDVSDFSVSPKLSMSTFKLKLWKPGI